MTQTYSGDRALRAMTDDGAFRAIVVRTTDTVDQLLRAQKAEGAAAERLGELATGAVLVRETMAPDYRLQALLRSGDKKRRLVADSHPDGGTRGLLSGGSERQDFDMAGGPLEIGRRLFRRDPPSG